jgi:chromosome segregation ATPase
MKREPSKVTTSPAVRFKLQVKRRAAAWQTVQRTIALIRQDAPNLNEWRKKLSEIDSFRRISSDLAQKLQQSRADALLENTTRRTETSQLQQKISVLSADLAAAQDLSSKTDEKIAKLAANLAKSEASKVEGEKSLAQFKKTISDMNADAVSQRKNLEEMERKFKQSEKRRKAAELLLEEETKAKTIMETKAEETRTSAVSLAEKMSSEKAELNRHVVNLSVENKALKARIETLKTEITECRENAKLDATKSMEEHAELRTVRFFDVSFFFFIFSLV